MHKNEHEGVVIIRWLKRISKVIYWSTYGHHVVLLYEGENLKYVEKFSIQKFFTLILGNQDKDTD